MAKKQNVDYVVIYAESGHGFQDAAERSVKKALALPNFISIVSCSTVVLCRQRDGDPTWYASTTLVKVRKEDKTDA